MPIVILYEDKLEYLPPLVTVARTLAAAGRAVSVVCTAAAL